MSGRCRSLSRYNNPPLDIRSAPKEHASPGLRQADGVGYNLRSSRTNLTEPRARDSQFQFWSLPVKLAKVPFEISAAGRCCTFAGRAEILTGSLILSHRTGPDTSTVRFRPSSKCDINRVGSLCLAAELYLCILLFSDSVSKGHCGSASYMHLRLIGGAERAYYLSVPEHVLTVVTVIQDTDIWDMGWAIVHVGVISEVTDSVLGTVGKQIIPA